MIGLYTTTGNTDARLNPHTRAHGDLPIVFPLRAGVEAHVRGNVDDLARRHNELKRWYPEAGK